MTTIDGRTRNERAGRLPLAATRRAARLGTDHLRFSVVLPCFNEEQAILATLAELRRCLRDAGPHELIVVDDGSTDGTPQLLRAAAEQDPELRVIAHAHNRGYGASLKTGIGQAAAELVVITDADRTYPNERIPDLLRLAERGADMVVGARTAPASQHSTLRSIPKWFLRRYASWIAGTKIPDLNSGLRVFRRDLARQMFYIVSDGFSFTTTITLAMLCNNFTVHYEPVTYAHRVGKSKIHPIRDTLRICHLITRAGLCFRPLRATLPVVFSVCALLLGSIGYDVTVMRAPTIRTLVLVVLSINLGLFALLAEAMSMIQRRFPFELGEVISPNAEVGSEDQRLEVAEARESRAA